MQSGAKADRSRTRPARVCEFSIVCCQQQQQRVGLSDAYYVNVMHALRHTAHISRGISERCLCANRKTPLMHNINIRCMRLMCCGVVRLHACGMCMCIKVYTLGIYTHFVVYAQRDSNESECANRVCACVFAVRRSLDGGACKTVRALCHRSPSPPPFDDGSLYTAEQSASNARRFERGCQSDKHTRV